MLTEFTGVCAYIYTYARRIYMWVCICLHMHTEFTGVWVYITYMHTEFICVYSTLNLHVYIGTPKLHVCVYIYIHAH